MKLEIDSKAIIISDLNTPLPIMGRIPRQKINKE